MLPFDDVIMFTTHVHYDKFLVIGVILQLPHCQWSHPKRYGYSIDMDLPETYNVTGMI